MYSYNNTLICSRLKELVIYDPNTGVMTWRKSRNGASKGTILGSTSTVGYIGTTIDNVEYQVHRLAWLYVTGAWPTEEIDHINGNPSDNHWVNLREATRTENGRNQKLFKTNTSGHVGVYTYLSKTKGLRHEVTIHANKKCIRLGTFGNFKKAVEVREAAEQKYGYHTNHGKPR